MRIHTDWHLRSPLTQTTTRKTTKIMLLLLLSAVRVPLTRFCSFFVFFRDHEQRVRRRTFLFFVYCCLYPCILRPPLTHRMLSICNNYFTSNDLDGRRGNPLCRAGSVSTLEALLTLTWWVWCWVNSKLELVHARKYSHTVVAALAFFSQNKYPGVESDCFVFVTRSKPNSTRKERRRGQGTDEPSSQ